MTAGLKARLRALVGETGLVDTAADVAGYRGDLALTTQGEIVGVVRPRTTAETAAVVRACAEAGIAMVPRGGGTGLAGGAAPPSDRPAVVVSFERMRAIRSIDPVGDIMIVEAGCTLHDAREAAAAADRQIGLDHGGLSSQIGGNLSTNAGGNNVLRYGMAREQVLGLEAVLADGEVLSQLAPLRKNNAGYDLKQLLLGAEGTLGLITAAALKLRPRPAVRVTACLGLATLDAVLALFTRARSGFGEAVTAFELIPRAGFDLHFSHTGSRREPFPTETPWAVLIEADSASPHFDLAGAMEALSAAAIEDGTVIDGTIAASEAQRQALWTIREGIALAMIETPGSLKNDVAVPVPAIGTFVVRSAAAVAALAPGCRPVPFGHVGDGNIHFNILPPEGMPAAAFKARWADLTQAIETVALGLGGTVSAEHGIGAIKRAALRRMRSTAELDTMRRLKAAFDPQGLLNPGKIL
ncbi:putative FAD-linked oxidoreductase [bacterium YEK0313]|nr:putative FAD-linked oxidoreductase [bacterium YEK0313]